VVKTGAGALPAHSTAFSVPRSHYLTVLQSSCHTENAMQELLSSLAFRRAQAGVCTESLHHEKSETEQASTWKRLVKLDWVCV
jgi:hypothetical protein